MSQNLVIPSRDNRVTMTFAGVDLTLATDLQVSFGSESYTLSLNPTVVIVTSATELSLDLSGTSEVGQHYITVTYFDGASVGGTDITSQELNNLGKIIVAIGTQLIIEDGTQITDANSFGSDSEYKAYALLRGLTVAATQPEREADLIAAMDYIQSIEADLQGCRTSSTQELPFPRRNVLLNGWLIATDVIPKVLKNAQFELASYSTSADLMLNKEQSNLASFSVDGVYSESYHKGGSATSVRLDRVYAQLSGLMNNINTLVRT